MKISIIAGDEGYGPNVSDQYIVKVNGLYPSSIYSACDETGTIVFDCYRDMDDPISMEYLGQFTLTGQKVEIVERATVDASALQFVELNPDGSVCHEWKKELNAR